MDSNVLFSGRGVYVPQVCPNTVLWRRDRTGDPWVGVQLNSARHATTMGNVFVMDGAGLVDYLTQKAQEK